MTIDAEYLAALSPERRPPSLMAAILPPDDPPLDLDGARGRARRAGAEVTRAAPGAAPGEWIMDLRLAAGDGPVQEQALALCAAPPPPDGCGGRLSASARAAARRSRFAISCQTTFRGDPLAAFHAQLRTLATLVPDAPAVHDAAALATHPGDWARDRAASRVPPEPATLFTIHAVSEPGGNVWYHTHGLARCGTLEIEALDVPPGVERLGHFLNAVGALFLDGPPPPRRPFEAGVGIVLAWMPWQEAVGRLKRGTGGTGDDRNEDHSGFSAALFVPRRRLSPGRGYDDLSALAPALAKDPMVYKSDVETERAALLARDRFDHFAGLFSGRGGAKGWAFLVKLGFPTGGGGREHVWFEVHAIDGDFVDATCLNAPRGIPALSQGLRGRHPLSLLTDFSIETPRGSFDPDGVLALVRSGGPALH